MTEKCEIKWVDANGNPTPDENPAICRVRCKARVEQHHGRALQFSSSQWFNCCAHHAKRLFDPGMHIWECEAVKAMAVPLAGVIEVTTAHELLARLGLANEEAAR